MSTSRIERLPKELIYHIATFVEALSLLALSRTSKTIRAVCWDSFLFKEILQNSQRLNWRDDSLDLEAIGKQAGNDIVTWARYAVADDQAWVLAGIKDPLQSRRRSISFLPELAVVKHPFLKQPCWFMATHGPFDSLLDHVFSVTTAILSADDVNLNRYHNPGDCEYCYPKPRENDRAFLDGEGALWTVCSTAITLRDGLRMRRSVWPYNAAANIPYIDFPRADRIPLRPLTGDYALPVPFSQRAEELLNSFTASSSSWHEWNRQHNHALFKQTFEQGRWCGYYTYNNMQPLDPPMMQIRFQRARARALLHPAINPGNSYHFRATECLDGIGNFYLDGDIGWDGKVVTVSAQKRYEMGTIWDWDCRLTPFGIVGHWGRRRMASFDIYGYVWLWKEEWNHQAARPDSA